MSLRRANLLLLAAVSACAQNPDADAVGESAQAATAPEKVYFPPDVVGQFMAITDRADALGFGIGDSPDPSLCYHYQGVARSSGPGTPYLFVSKSGNHPPGVPCLQWCEDMNLPCTEVGDGPGNLLVVRMGSRATDGERFRSNRLARNTETKDSPPPAEDAVVKTITFDGTGEWPSFGHPGGMQVVGDVLVVPLEVPYSGDTSLNQVIFIDVRNPEDPHKIAALEVPVTSDFTLGAVAVSPLPDGRYLLMVTGKDNTEVRFFESSVSDLGLLDPELVWTHADTWFPDDDPVIPSQSPGCELLPPGVHPSYPNGLYAGWPDGGLLGGAYQSLNFVRQAGPDGPLFLIGGRNTSQIFGEDWFDLFQVTHDGDHYRLTCAGRRHVYTFPSSDGALLFHNNIANFAAGTGSYVSPTGELILYGTEHDNDGPGGTVKMGEWRHRDMVRPGSPTYDPTVEPGGPYSVPEGSSIALEGAAAPPRTKAWIELWTDPDWEDDRYLVIDYPDWSLDDFDDFEELDDANNNPLKHGFSDQATSARWFAPSGCALRLNDDDFSDDDFPGSHTRTLPGDGLVHGVAHLSDLESDSGGEDLDDELTSAQFFSDCDAYYDPSALSLQWDLDGDGTFETSSAGSFSAASLDGPSLVTVDARALHSIDGRVGTGSARIEVVNVAPLVSGAQLVDGAGRVIGVDVPIAIAGLPLRLSATFTDPGVADTQSAEVAWGDGTSSGPGDIDAFTHATGGVTGSVDEAHVYAAPGFYTATLSVADDDGGVGVAATSVQVVDAAGAIQSVIDQLDALLATTSGAAHAALMDARDDLDGNQLGSAKNGALDALEGGQLVAAMVKISAALEALDEAEAATGLDLEGMKGTLALAALAIGNGAYLEAVAANSPPKALEAARLQAIEQLLESAAAAVGTGDWSAAVDEVTNAVQLAASMY